MNKMATRNKNHEPSLSQEADDLIAVLDGEKAHDELGAYIVLLQGKLERGEIGMQEYNQFVEDAVQLYAIGPGLRERKALDHLNHTGPVRRFGHHIIESLRHK